MGTRIKESKSGNKTSTVIFSVLKEFAEKTSMDGLRFIANEEASIGERILWFFLSSGGVIFGLFFSSILWDNWNNQPIQITIDSANHQMTKYPFPTVTVCSINTASKHMVHDLIQTFEDLKLEDLRKIIEIFSTNRVRNDEKLEHYSQVLEKNNITSDLIPKIMHNISPNCSDMIVYCEWEDQEVDCGKAFAEESTDGGYCCSFNSIIIYRNNFTTPKKLLHGQTAGVYGGLSIILNAELEDYNVTSSDAVGFRVSIQAPDEFARTGKMGFLVSPGSQVDAAVTGQAQICDEQLIKVDVRKRMCAIGNEIELKYFEDYTSPYCFLECLTTSLLSQCACVPFYFPVPITLPNCNISSYSCVEKVMAFHESNSSFCFCPEKCSYEWYRNEISTGVYPNSISEYPASLIDKFNKSDCSYLLRDMEIFKTYAKKNFAKLNVYYKSTNGVCYTMNPLTTWADFISATGGLLGLGLGFSLMSAAEILYFLFFRWFFYCNKTSNKNNPNEIKVAPSIIPLDYFKSSSQFPN